MNDHKAEVIYENTRPAEFIKRNNRFTAEVLIDGRQETVHVKNTGRLSELLLQGAKVTLQKADDPSRKTQYDLISIYHPDLEWVNIDSLAPNKLVKKLYIPEYDLVKAEYRYGKSRVDFYMEKAGEK